MRSHAFRGTADPAVKISVVEPDPGSLKAQSKIPNPLGGVRRWTEISTGGVRRPTAQTPIPNPLRRGPPVDGNFDGRGPPSHGPNPNPKTPTADSGSGPRRCKHRPPRR
jgi:hypothetical protein